MIESTLPAGPCPEYAQLTYRADRVRNPRAPKIRPAVSASSHLSTGKCLKGK